MIGAHGGLRAFGAWHFCVRKNAECINRGVRFPRALPGAVGNIWAYSPPQSIPIRRIVAGIMQIRQHDWAYSPPQLFYVT